jgi:hypothetical protein
MPGLYMLLVGLSIGLATFSLLSWIATRLQQNKPGEESAQIAQQLKVMAYANLLLTPLLMYLIYTFAYSGE